MHYQFLKLKRLEPTCTEIYRVRRDFPLEIPVEMPSVGGNDRGGTVTDPSNSQRGKFPGKLQLKFFLGYGSGVLDCPSDEAGNLSLFQFNRIDKTRKGGYSRKWTLGIFHLKLHVEFRSSRMNSPFQNMSLEL